MARWDVLIVGGGPAGLSAALVLGRCRRRVLLCDAGRPRNERSAAMHGFLSRDGMHPAEFLWISRVQIRAYSGVELRVAEVTRIEGACGDFRVHLRDGLVERARRVLLATGLVDELPTIPGVVQFYGRSVHHCPYCDGWERRDQPLAVTGSADAAAELALELLRWSRDVVLCTNGPSAIGESLRARLHAADVSVREDPIDALEGEGHTLAGIRFRNGDFLPRAALFFSPGQYQRSPLAEQLGCCFGDDGCVTCGDDASTSVPGIHAAGNATRGLQLVIMAAAEGTLAGFAINEALHAEEQAVLTPPEPALRPDSV